MAILYLVRIPFKKKMATLFGCFFQPKTKLFNENIKKEKTNVQEIQIPRKGGAKKIKKNKQANLNK